MTLKHYTNTVEHETLRPYMVRVNDQIDRLGQIDNAQLKAQDPLNRLKKAVNDLEEFEQYRDGLGEMKRLVTRLG